MCIYVCVSLFEYLHHVLEDVGLCVRVAVPLGFADDAVVLEQEDVAVVTPGRGTDPRGTFPHLERPLVGTKPRTTIP